MLEKKIETGSFVKLHTGPIDRIDNIDWSIPPTIWYFDIVLFFNCFHFVFVF